LTDGGVIATRDGDRQIGPFMSQNTRKGDGSRFAGEAAPAQRLKTSNPPGMELYLGSVGASSAMGQIRAKNRTVVCWRGRGRSDASEHAAVKSVKKTGKPTVSALADKGRYGR
jgi:hypothetical protein